MAKNDQIRINDTLAYITAHLGAGVANEIRGLIAGHEAAISNELSLGARWDFISPSAARTDKRHALRALLLCQRVYHSDLWPTLMGLVSQRIVHDWLPVNWRQQSFGFWRHRSEHEINQALAMYTSATDDVRRLATAAERGQPSAPNNLGLTATRASFVGTATATCYDAVMLWLFKSGLVSLRWLRRYRNGNTQQDLTEAFGAGEVIWNGAFGEDDHLPAVPRGHIVHIYQDQNAWRGHWMVSTGDGGAAGCNNNDEEPAVDRAYSAALTLDGQFRDFGRGTAVKINPALIPGRH